MSYLDTALEEYAFGQYAFTPLETHHQKVPSKYFIEPGETTGVFEFR